MVTPRGSRIDHLSPPVEEKGIWLISQPTSRVIYFPSTGSVCPGWGGELFSSPGGAEHVRMRQHQRGPLLTIDRGHAFKIATRSPGGTHNPAPKQEYTRNHTLSCRALSSQVEV